MTELARRRRMAKDIRTVAASVPVAYVESPLETVLASVQRVVSVELAFMEQAQAEDGKPMSPAEAKKLSNLMNALERSVSVGREITEKEGAAMSEEELEAQLVLELERIRAR